MQQNSECFYFNLFSFYSSAYRTEIKYKISKFTVIINNKVSNVYLQNSISKIIFHCTKHATKYPLDYWTLTEGSVEEAFSY